MTKPLNFDQRMDAWERRRLNADARSRRPSSARCSAAFSARERS
jgi:hypothetical protein